MIRTIIILFVTLLVVPVVAIWLDPQPLCEMQWTMIQRSAFMMFGAAMACFVLAEMTKNCSQVDKIWSIMPVVYVWYFAAASEWQERLVLMAVCVTLWGVRLTYNFSRRGAYRLKFWEGEEDYRWEVLRQNSLFKGKPLRWTLFNFFFISLYQNTLIWLCTLPALMAFAANHKPLSWIDGLLAVVMIGFIVIETIADQQQWNYQNEKHRRLKAGIPPDGEYGVGFLRTGLWGIVRHPNYASEQAIWITFYFFSVAATGSWVNWSVAGCLLLLVLFQGSSDFSESISAGKYPAYKEYQKKVGRFLPKFF